MSDKFKIAWGRITSDDEDQDGMEIAEEVFCGRHWGDIADEARRFFSVATDIEIEKDSPYDDLLHGVVIHSWKSAFRSVAEALGVDADDLETVCSDYFENPPDSVPEPLGVDGLKPAIAKWRAHLDAISGGETGRGEGPE